MNSLIPKLPFRFPFIYKFVDDIICAVPHDMIQVTVDTFNKFNKNIQFTVEIETDSSVPFLDTKVIRTSTNSIILNWYQKPASSGRFLNYFSNHPINQKINTILAMKNRITHISNSIFINDNLKKLKNLFLNNGYPGHLLNKLIYSSNFYDGPTEENTEPNVKYKKLPYIRSLTEKIISFFKPFKNIKIAKYNTKKNRQLFTKVKDITPLPFNTNIVYSVSCLGCQGCYIGQTCTWLKQRISQHKSDCRLGKHSCALAQHVHTTNHQFDFDNIKILDFETNQKKRLFLEMYHINKNKNSINYKSDIQKLSNIYCNILNFEKPC